MRTLIIATLLALPLATAPAFAEGARMSTLEFARANRCLAYANLAALRNDETDFSSLQQRFDAAFAAKPFSVRSGATNEARMIRISAQSAVSAREIDGLRARRDSECRSFSASIVAKSRTERSGG